MLKEQCNSQASRVCELARARDCLKDYLPSSSFLNFNAPAVVQSVVSTWLLEVFHDACSVRNGRD